MSEAIGIDRISRVVGYKITKGDFSTVSPNLPQRVAILAEANEANQSTLVLTPTQITTLKQAGVLYGYGSPIYNIIRILMPVNGGGIGGIPIWVYPQAKASGATARVVDIEVSGVATDNATHTVVIGGRYNLDGTSYDIAIEAGDTQDIIYSKIEDAVNNVLGCPASASSTDYEATLTTKWNGLTAQDVTVSVDTNNKSVGLTYTVTQTQAGTATPSVAAALELFGNNWNTITINSYGTVSTVMSALEGYNGIPDPENPTGRFVGDVMKPFIALTGSVAEDPSSITDARKDNATIAICPAPLSDGHPMEAAANMCVWFAVKAQATPHLDVEGMFYPDMPTPGDIGAMDTYNNRDAIVKKGCSTVLLTGGKYQVQDFVTTYHPEGENPPQFRYCRNLMLDFNVYFGWNLILLINVADHAIAADSDPVSVSKVIKPKQVKALISSYATDLASRALIADVEFMKSSATANLDSSNPDRINVFYRYKRTGTARIVSTIGEAGFNFGTL
jgi:phage tail sheath gpL-like